MSATSVALEPRLARYVDTVRATCASGPIDRARIEALRAAAAELVREPLHLRPDQRVVPAQGYGRNLLYRDPDHGFVVIAMVWPGGIVGRPHDHATWGVVAVAEGEVEVIDYAAVPRDPEGAFLDLTPTSRVVGGPGATAYVLPPELDVHRVANADPDRVAVSIHTYGRSIDRCRLVDAGDGRVEWVEPQYHSVPDPSVPGQDTSSGAPASG